MSQADRRGSYQQLRGARWRWHRGLDGRAYGNSRDRYLWEKQWFPFLQNEPCQRQLAERSRRLKKHGGRRCGRKRRRRLRPPSDTNLEPFPMGRGEGFRSGGLFSTYIRSSRVQIPNTSQDHCPRLEWPFGELEWRSRRRLRLARFLNTIDHVRGVLNFVAIQLRGGGL
jgi:hypothetical protein